MPLGRQITHSYSHQIGIDSSTPSPLHWFNKIKPLLILMRNQTIKDIENRLWEAADNLRANSSLSSYEYSTVNEVFDHVYQCY